MARAYNHKHKCSCGRGVRLPDGICFECVLVQKKKASKCKCGGTKSKNNDTCSKCRSKCVQCGGPKALRSKSEKCISCLVMRHRDCVICGNTFKLKSHNKRVTCSDECKAVALKESANRAAQIAGEANRRIAKEQEARRKKERFDRLLESKRADKGLCVCRLAVLERPRQKTCVNCRVFITGLVDKLKRMRVVKQCKRCGKEFTNRESKSSKYCSKDCYRQSDDGIAARQAGAPMRRARRRAREKATVVHSVNPMTVFIRDGWSCVYCGKCVRQYKAHGWLSGDEATIDHVKPLSIGGEHSYDNLVTACMDCNVKKGDRYYAE